VSEYLSTRWPRLPMKTQLAALWAYTGESALSRISREWGIQPQSSTLKRGDKKKPKEIEAGPALIVNTKRNEVQKQLDNGAMEWQIREQARQGWLERGKEGETGISNPTNNKEYEEHFVLRALQRFVQALVGGIYVHSVLYSLP